MPGSHGINCCWLLENDMGAVCEHNCNAYKSQWRRKGKDKGLWCYQLLMYCSNVYVHMRQPKCHQYWPHIANNPITYGNISVTLLQENILSCFIIRKLVLKKVHTYNTVKSENFKGSNFLGFQGFSFKLKNLYSSFFKSQKWVMVAM